MRGTKTQRMRALTIMFAPAAVVAALDTELPAKAPPTFAALANAEEGLSCRVPAWTLGLPESEILRTLSLDYCGEVRVLRSSSLRMRAC